MRSGSNNIDPVSEVRMKRQLMLAFAMLFVFGLGTATLAATDCCSCCKGDSCPMKQKEVSGKEASCCDDCDCRGDAKTAKTVVASYFKGQPIYKTGKTKCKCCSGVKDAKRT